jgi:hypothetical protein
MSNLGGGIYNSIYNSIYDKGRSSNSIISGNTANQVWYIDLNGGSTTSKYSQFNGQLIPIDPNTYHTHVRGTSTALPPTPDSLHLNQMEISVSNAWFDAPAGEGSFCGNIMNWSMSLSSSSS